MSRQSAGASPTVITNPEPGRYEYQKDIAFKIAATLGGTTSDNPFHVELQQAVIEKAPGSAFHIPSYEIMSHIGETPIHGTTEYRVRGNQQRGSINTKFSIYYSKSYESSSDIFLLPRDMNISQSNLYYQDRDVIKWNSQEELADKITDLLRLIKIILNTPIIQPSSIG